MSHPPAIYVKNSDDDEDDDDEAPLLALDVTPQSPQTTSRARNAIATRSPRHIATDSTKAHGAARRQPVLRSPIAPTRDDAGDDDDDDSDLMLSTLDKARSRTPRSVKTVDDIEEVSEEDEEEDGEEEEGADEEDNDFSLLGTRATVATPFSVDAKVHGFSDDYEEESEEGDYEREQCQLKSSDTTKKTKKRRRPSSDDSDDEKMLDGDLDGFVVNTQDMPVSTTTTTMATPTSTMKLRTPAPLPPQMILRVPNAFAATRADDGCCYLYRINNEEQLEWYQAIASRSTLPFEYYCATGEFYTEDTAALTTPIIATHVMPRQGMDVVVLPIPLRDQIQPQVNLPKEYFFYEVGDGSDAENSEENLEEAEEEEEEGEEEEDGRKGKINADNDNDNDNDNDDDDDDDEPLSQMVGARQRGTRKRRTRRVEASSSSSSSSDDEEEKEAEVVVKARAKRLRGIEQSDEDEEEEGEEKCTAAARRVGKRNVAAVAKGRKQTKKKRRRVEQEEDEDDDDDLASFVVDDDDDDDDDGVLENESEYPVPQWREQMGMHGGNPEREVAAMRSHLCRGIEEVRSCSVSCFFGFFFSMLNDWFLTR